MIKLWSAFISRQYRNCTEHQLDRLNCINLVKPEFFIPTADASHLVDWGKIFAEYWVRELPLDLSQPLLNLIDKQIEKIPNFDFRMIQSLTNSKGFGSYSYTINGSWFRDIGSWGRAMYPSDTMGGMHDLDWKRNIKHVEREAFRLESPIYVEHLDWLDRYVAFQAGGSHHAALVVHQMKVQNREYIREADCLRLKIKLKMMENVEKNYYSFITHKKLFSPRFCNGAIEGEHIFRHEAFDSVHSLPMSGSPHNLVILFLKKHSLKIDKQTFDEWYKTRVNAGLIIPLVDMLSNTLKYCSTPYSHLVHDIWLGDPQRVYETQARMHDAAL